MIKNRVMMHALMMGAMAYSMASKKEGDTNGAPAETAPVDGVDVVNPETASPVADGSVDPVATAVDPGVTFEGDEATEINESNLPPDPEPHPVGSVLDEIESAIGNYAHELTAGFKSIIEDLVKKAKDLV
jgi:hypothetical protein